MAQQIKKKFLSQEVINYFDNQIETVEQSVTSEQTRAQGAEQTLDGKIEQEKLDRQSADTALSGRVSSLETQVGENLQGQISGLSSAISAEATARQNADSTLDGKIATEKARIDAILAASTADKDSFAEIVSLINSVDTENDTAFGSYVTSNNARVGAVESGLASEITNRQSADASTLQSAKDYADAKFAAIPPVDLTNYYTKSEVDGKDSVLSGQISSVSTSVSGLQSDLDSLEVYAQDLRSDVDGHDSQLTDHESRIDALEAKTDGPQFANGAVVVGAQLAYIDLDRQYTKLMSCAVGRMAVHEGEDFTVSTVAGKTRLTWIGSLVSPSGAEAIETGDKVFFVGAY